MAKWLMGLALIAALIAVPAGRAQYSPGSPSPGDPLPVGPAMAPPPSHAGPGAMPPGQGPMNPMPSSKPMDAMVLPAHLPGAFPAEGDAKCCRGETVTLWFSGEYLHWWLKDGHIAAPLVTTSLTPSLPDNVGSIGQSGTVVVLGGRAGEHQVMDVPGGRIMVGVAPRFCLPIEAGVSFLQKDLTLFETGQLPPGAVQARPVFVEQDIIGNPFSVFLYNFPGLVAGGINVTSATNLVGVDVTAILNVQNLPFFAFDWLLGYRFQSLNEELGITSSVSVVDPDAVLEFNGNPDGFPMGFTTIVEDRFKARNNFHGGHIGARSQFRAGPVNLFLDGRLAIGNTQQVLDVEGSSTLVPPLAPIRPSATVPGGLLAVASNSGHFTRNEFTIIPEAQVTLSVQINRITRLFVGYKFLYWSSVVRPGEQVDTIIDTRQVPTDISFSTALTASRPPPNFRQTDFWAHGLSLGLAFGW